MEYYTDRLKNELKKILDFWQNNMVPADRNYIYAEFNLDSGPNPDAPLGSMYLSRIIYGASAACNYLHTETYKTLADIAFKMLYEEFRNPAGGFYWAKSYRNEVIHDTGNTNMAQAFILYGLSEYAKLTNNPIVEAEIKKLNHFIENTLKDETYGGYLDGFTSDWKQQKKFSKSLGTHLHLLEAKANKYSVTKNPVLIEQISDLIDIIIERFISKDTLECYHQLNINWDPLPNNNWAGHNFEVSWILHQTAQLIGNEDNVKLTGQLAVDITRKYIEEAFDKSYGGVFNVIVDEKPADDFKEWWPQAEAAIACLNAYLISSDKYFLSYGLRLIEYIDNTFSHGNRGEWYTSVSKDGQPNRDMPSIHFWKSLYHNVRYCIETSKRIQAIASPFKVKSNIQ